MNSSKIKMESSKQSFQDLEKKFLKHAHTQKLDNNAFKMIRTITRPEKMTQCSLHRNYTAKSSHLIFSPLNENQD